MSQVPSSKGARQQGCTSTGQRDGLEGRAPEGRAPVGVMEYHAPTNADGLTKGAVWRIENWELFQAEFPTVESARLAAFHAMVERNVRSWTIVRRLFGFTPLSVPLDGNPDDYRVWSRYELCQQLGIGEKELNAELEAVREAWGRVLVQSPKSEVQGQRRDPRDAGATRDGVGGAPGVLLEEDDAVLKSVGVPTNIFELPNRPKEDNQFEKAWFVQRVREYRKLFDKPMTARLALQALFNEMRLRREELVLWQLDLEEPENDTKRVSLQRTKDQIRERIKELEQAYQGLLERIEEHAPWFNATGRQINVTGAVGEMIKGIQEFKAAGENKILDGINTALEIQVLCRQDHLSLDPQYRAGWVTYVNSTRAFLMDPNFKPMFRESDIAKMDAGWKGAVRALAEEGSVPVPDLEKDGPEGEYEDLHLRPEDEFVRPSGAAPIPA